MKIYQPAKNIAPKVSAIFLILIGAVGFILPGINEGGLWFMGIGILLIAVGIATFFGKSERYIDTEEMAIVSIKKWLFINSKSEVPLRLYKYVRVIENSESSSTTDCSHRFYDVNLVAKNTTSDHSGGFDINVFLAQYPRTEEGREQAITYAKKVSHQIGLPLHAEQNF